MSEQEKREAPEHAQPGVSEGVNPDDAPQDPDSEAGPDVEPAEVESRGEQAARTAANVGFDPSRPVATSAPPPEAQSGVPGIPENEGVEGQPQYAGPVIPGQEEAPEDRPPDQQTTHPAEPSE